MFREIEDGSVDFDCSEQFKEFDIAYEVYGNIYEETSISKAIAKSKTNPIQKLAV